MLLQDETGKARFVEVSTSWFQSSVPMDTPAAPSRRGNLDLYRIAEHAHRHTSVFRNVESMGDRLNHVLAGFEMKFG